MNDAAQSAALVDLLAALRERRYHFITPTPLTHARVIARADRRQARDLRDVFGWSLPFRRELIDADILAAMEAARIIEPHGDLLKSRVRVSSLDADLFLHSAYPTIQPDSVFFGPDSYRFATFLKAELPRLSPRMRVVDIGTGSGVGAIIAARSTPGMLLAATDINPAALALAAANARAANLYVEFCETDGLAGVDGRIDCIIANPPYIADPLRRAYRDGGGMYGAALSLQFAREAAEHLSKDGALLLYTGAAIVNGEDRFKTLLTQTLRGFDVSYKEIDPDVFGEELEREDYADVERISVVGVVAVKR